MDISKVNADTSKEISNDSQKDGQGAQNRQQAPAAEKGDKFNKAVEAMQNMKNSGREPSKELPNKEEAKKDEATPNGDTPKDDWEKRYKDVQVQKDREVTAATQQAEDIAREAVNANPELIHSLAKKNPALADKIVATDPECEKHGIKTYKELMSALEKANLPEDQKKVVDKIEQLEKKVEEQGAKLSDQDKEKAELFIAQFKEQHPEFKGEIEKKTWELFKNTNLKLDECLDYIKYKEGVKEDVNQLEEKAFEGLQNKAMAGAIPGSGARTAGKGNKKAINAETADFLEGIGAKKTLQKYGS